MSVVIPKPRDPSTPSRRPTVAILCRQDETVDVVERYAVFGMAQYWQSHGIVVRWVFGPAPAPVDADLLLVHVNLSLVPEPYIRFARLHPRVLNADIADIRKGAVCEHLVHEDDAWSGPVIVKSNLNSAGRPELHASGRRGRMLAKLKLLVRRLGLTGSGVHISRQQDYRVFDSVAAVPRACFGDPSLVVQRFLPEMEGDLYCVRSYAFLGDRHSCLRLVARQPVVGRGNAVRIEVVEPHATIIAARQRLGMDYGKLDYVMHAGKAILLDVNKTLGAAPDEDHPAMLAMRQERARGIFGYLGMEVPAR